MQKSELQPLQSYIPLMLQFIPDMFIRICTLLLFFSTIFILTACDTQGIPYTLYLFVGLTLTLLAHQRHWCRMMKCHSLSHKQIIARELQVLQYGFMIILWMLTLYDHHAGKHEILYLCYQKFTSQTSARKMLPKLFHVQ